MMRPVRSLRVLTIATLASAALLAGCGGGSSGPDTSSASTDGQNLALATEHDGNYDSAARQFAVIVANDPNNITAIVGEARNLRYGNHDLDALKILNEAIRRLGPKYELRLELAKATITGPHWEDSIPIIEDLQKEHPDDWRSLVLLGMVNDRNGKFAEAQVSYRKALDLNPDHIEIIVGLATSLAMDGKLDEAIHLLEGVADRSDAPLKVRLTLATFYAFHGEMGKAEAILRANLSPDAADQELRALRQIHPGGAPTDLTGQPTG